MMNKKHCIMDLVVNQVSICQKNLNSCQGNLINLQTHLTLKCGLKRQTNSLMIRVKEQVWMWTVKNDAVMLLCHLLYMLCTSCKFVQIIICILGLYKL
jgi:hypothetical protein